MAKSESRLSASRYETVGMTGWASIVVWLVAAAGCGYLIAAWILVGRFAGGAASAATVASASAPGVTILKPLHGDEPALFDNLASFCVQDYAGPVQIIFGVKDANDPALATVERLRMRFPGAALDLVVNAAVHGPNGKVSNLINMMPQARHDIVVLADSDIRVERSWLRRVMAALQAPGVAGVTRLYYEPTDGGLITKLSALGVNAHFLPNVIVGLASGRARPCFGSTIAFRGASLDAIGGFAAMADCLADDYALGEALRATGGVVAVPPFAVAHMSRPMSAGEFWRHELRWARTIAGVDPLGYVGSLVTHPLPFALVAAILGRGSSVFAPALALTAGAIIGRMMLLKRLEHAFKLPKQSYWLMPLRDLLSCVVFLASFLGTGVSWHGQRYRVRGGTLIPQWRSPKP